MRQLKAERNHNLINVKDVINHIKQQPSIEPEHFLQEDFYSSMHYKERPKEQLKLVQMRFQNEN